MVGFEIKLIYRKKKKKKRKETRERDRQKEIGS